MTGLAGEICDRRGSYFEHTLAYRLIRWGVRAKIAGCSVFRRRPIVVGVSGSTGRRLVAEIQPCSHRPFSWAEHRIVSMLVPNKCKCRSSDEVD